MPAVQSRAVQTEAAPSQKTGLKSLEVCYIFLKWYKYQPVDSIP